MTEHNCNPCCATTEQVASGQLSLSDYIHQASLTGIRETSEVGRDVTGAIRQAAAETARLGELNLQATERNGGAGIAATERTAAGTRDTIAFVANQIQRDFAGISRDVCDSRRENSEGVGDVKLEAAKNHAALQLEMCKQHGELQRQADANAAALAKQLAECCCDLKQEHGATRELLLKQSADECLRRENAALGELNMLRMQQWQASQRSGGGHK